MTDVLVLGAGLAGLAAARDLAAAGTDVVVLEARDRGQDPEALLRAVVRTLATQAAGR